MKTTTLLLILIVCQSTLCFCQSLVREGKLWSNAIIGSENIDIYNSYWIKFQGDTTLNNVLYKKILRADDSLHSDWYLSGFIREDTVAQKVYLFNNHTESDQLLYNFSLEKGDSILIWDGLTFAKIDTVLYEPFGDSKDTLKQICFNKGCTHKWIKGIGSSRGVLNGLNTIKTVGAYYYLVCYYENETLVYHNPDYKTCFPDNSNVSILNTEMEKSIEVYPNPVKDVISISNPHDIKIEKIEIFDFSGIVAKKWDKWEPRETILKIESFKPGIYLLKIETEFGMITEKLIVE